MSGEPNEVEGAAKKDFMTETHLPQTEESREETNGNLKPELAEGIGEREKLDIHRCQYGVPCSSAYRDGYVADCGKPAIAKWTWNKGQPEESWIFVCEEHDAVVEGSEFDAPSPEPVSNDSPEARRKS